MRALAYLEWCFVRHHLEGIVRSPLRLAIWIPYALSLLFIAVARIAGGRHEIFGSFAPDAPRLTAVAGLYLALLGTTIALSAAGRVSGFRSRAEALLLSNSGIAPLKMAVWLQLRKVVSNALRWSGALIYYFLLFFPRHSTLGVAALAFLSSLLAVALLMGVELPVFLLARGSFEAGLRAFGWAVAAAGLSYAAVGFGGKRLWAASIAFVHVDPGLAVRSIQSGRPNAIVVFLGLLAILLLAIVTLARDSLPELYAVARHSSSEARVPRTTPRQRHYDAVRSTPASRIPRGALALAWKDWIGFRRTRGSLSLFLAGAAFWAACGLGVAYATRALNDYSALQALLATSGLLLLFVAPGGAALGLASDLGKPLFWLGDDALRLRLGAWTLGRAARGGLALSLAPLCTALVLHNWWLAIAALPLCLCAYWSLQALGIGLYAIFPNPIDSRGPMGLLRMVVTVVYILPAFVAGLAASALSESVLLASAVTCTALVVEGLLAIELAAIRLREQGAVIAQAYAAG
jgi:hypothetical protein